MRQTKQLTGNGVTGMAICDLVKRRPETAKLPKCLSPQSFRLTAITDLLTQGVPLDDVQHLAGHAEPRTTGLYDRRQRAEFDLTHSSRWLRKNHTIAPPFERRPNANSMRRLAANAQIQDVLVGLSNCTTFKNGTYIRHMTTNT